MDLIKSLIEQLGVKEDQARGGAGLIFKLAKQKLDGADFSAVTKAIPQVGDLISKAPAAGGLLGKLGGLASSMGGKAGALGDLAGLADGFSKLNLDKDMIAKFIPVIVSFLKSQGGAQIGPIIEKIQKSLTNG